MGANLVSFRTGGNYFNHGVDGSLTILAIIYEFVDDYKINFITNRSAGSWLFK